MATKLGKRQSRSLEAEQSVSQEDAQAIFKRLFESKFQPLETVPLKQQEEESDVDSEVSQVKDEEQEHGEAEWTGLSEDEGSDEENPTTAVEVVDHTKTAKPPVPILSKREVKALLSSRAPSLTFSTPNTTTSKSKTPTAAEEDSATLLKNDLALSRLISESHLFSSPQTNSFSAGTSHEHEGRNRHLATDLRISALGSKESIYKQKKMPRAMRQAITAAADSREAKRRKEAKENGIVLEKPAAKGKNDRIRKRDAAVDAPAVGRLRDGMLKLSKKDIRDIQGSDGARGGSKQKKRRR